MNSLQLFRERLSEKNVQATIPKGSMGYTQYTVPDTVAVEPTFVARFPLALTDICPWPLLPFFQISLKNSELKVPPAIPFGVVACTLSDYLPPS